MLFKATTIRIIGVFFCIFLSTGCASMMTSLEKVADPYDKKYKCKTSNGYECLDVEESYNKSEEENNAWAGGMTEFTISKNESAAFAKVINIYENPATDSISELGHNIDENVENEIMALAQKESNRSTADVLVDYITSKKIFPVLEGKLLRGIAETYAGCIRDAQEDNKKNTKKAAKGKLSFSEEDAVLNLRRCSSYLHNVPGLVAFRSNSLSEQLKIQRESELRRQMAKTVSPGDMPVKMPAKTIQVRICAYEDNKNLLIKDHHVYTTVGEGRWIFERSDGAGPNSIIKPLE